MSSLKWAWSLCACWYAASVTGDIWRIKITETGMFYLVDNNRLPYNAAPFKTLRRAKAWCEEREDELIEAQPARRLVKLYRSRTTDDVDAWEADRFVNEDCWKCVGSAWVTEGEFADD